MNRSIAIIGAGPIGLEFAVAAVARGHRVALGERDHAGANVHRWGHVTFFSPWKLNVSERGLAVLDAVGHRRPDPEAFPTGREYLDGYLAQLARWVAERGELLDETEVLAVGRGNLLKGEHGGGGDRHGAPFRLLLRHADGTERYLQADVVVDASGTYGNPNHLGPGGLPALGERTMRERITYVIPDPLGGDRDTYAGRTTLVVGDGYSAITTLNLLLALKEKEPATTIIWVARPDADPYDTVEGDPLPQRDHLARLGNRLSRAEAGVDYIGGHAIEALTEQDGRVQVTIAADDDTRRTIVVDNVVANVGYRPDASMLRELQVHQCYASEGPMKLAAQLLAQHGGDCLDQASTGADTLRNPEPDFYVIGSKSYGRNSQFLIRVGLQQVLLVLDLIDDDDDEDGVSG